MKRLEAGASLVALSLLLLAAGRADAQKRPQRMPYDIFDRSRPDRDRIAPPPPLITNVPTRPTVTPRPGVPSREFKLSPLPRSASPFDTGPYTYAPRYAPRYGVRSRPLRSYGYGYSGYGYGGYSLPYSNDDLSFGAPGVADANVDSPFATDTEVSLGRLFIDTEPGTAQIFVDGIPAGVVADFRGVGMLLTEGLRRIELRAPGYQGATFDVNIVPRQPAVHRGDLTPLGKTVEPGAPVRRGSDKFYVIPGCYMGNRPPRDVSLPPGCDISKTKTIN